MLSQQQGAIELVPPGMELVEYQHADIVYVQEKYVCFAAYRCPGIQDSGRPQVSRSMDSRIAHIFSPRSRLQPRFFYSIARTLYTSQFQPTCVCVGESGRSSWPCHQLHGVPGEWLVLGEAAGSRRLLLVCNRLFLHSCSSI